MNEIKFTMISGNNIIIIIFKMLIMGARASANCKQPNIYTIDAIYLMLSMLKALRNP